MTDEQLTTLWGTTNDSIALMGTWLNSAALWELFGAFVGFLIIASFVTMLIMKPLDKVGFRARY